MRINFHHHFHQSSTLQFQHPQKDESKQMIMVEWLRAHIFLHTVTFYNMFLSTGLCSYTRGALREYVLIQDQKTWDEAQAYCRMNHLDLATVQNNEDSANLQEAVYKMTKIAWIGLYNDINSWRWSYEDEKMTFQSWNMGEPNNYNGYEECVMMQGSTWNDWGCSDLLPFFCYNGKNL